MITVNQFEAGKKIEGFYLIKSVDCKTTNSNNKKYLDFTLGDKTGEINAKLWECNEDNEKLFQANMIVKVRGTILSWQNSLQLKIEKIRKSETEDNLDISEFVAAAPFSAEDMYNQVNQYIGMIKNQDIQGIVNEVLDNYKDKIMHFPAAKKNHHSIRSGLLYHVTTMLKAGEKLASIYTSLNTDLLYAGVILHDLAKMDEMDASELGIVSDYTVEGTLLGHITQGVKNIEVAAKKIGADKEITMLLEHMILSHHYEPEYGSPVKPMIPEAEMLHYLDIIDARMFDMNKAKRDIHPGEFSDRIWSLESRRVYKPIYDED
ncbi:3'-5' exoribonuclease YhaM family protein [Clostridium oryzae]|uniref:3'-5' exoribonuclease YhaM n=1 Tax=Clostridium oryzae TaxID=1450648 RepID=A0A1V4IWX6_9CLOT|nr:OB-fold nucleic acid binding domain-containing protein [Clostridium oryzae]OPJ64562.1 3'-5' exoribonuclease YhaM [Clostridium oryzae]